MSRRDVLLAVLLGVSLSVGWLFYKIHRIDNQSVVAGIVPHGFTRKDITLRPGEAVRVVIRPTHLAVVRPEGTKTEYISEGARTEVSVSTHGVVSVQVQHYGLSLSPGVSVAAVGGKLGVGVDVRFAFYDRLSLLGGIIVSPALTPYAGAGFVVFKRTSLFIGRGDKLWIGGLRVSF